VMLRTAGIGALLVSLSIGMTSNLLFLSAFQFRLDWFLEPTGILGGGAASARAAAVGGNPRPHRYYLSTAVLAYVLWRHLRPHHPLIADLATLAALGYVLAGGVGAAILAMVAPMLMHDYATAASADQSVVAVEFATLFEVVWRSIWQFLDGLLLPSLWLGIGLLIRTNQPGLSRLTLVLSGAATVESRPIWSGSHRPSFDARCPVHPLDGLVGLAARAADPLPGHPCQPIPL
jgi:hypothetical protein